MEFKEIKGNLISLAKMGKFDVIAHGCNCFCNMGAGIAPQMAEAFGADKFKGEHIRHQGNINKVGTIDFETIELQTGHELTVVNAYTQFRYGKNHKDGTNRPADYEAIALCMRKMNFLFSNMHIGLPLIGAGLAGGDWEVISTIIKEELVDVNVTIVHYDDTI